MMARVTYLGGLRTEAVHLKSGTRIITDAPVDNHGKGEAFSPTDLAAASLASCALTIMGIAAEQRGIDMEGAQASVVKVMADSPRRIARIEIEIRMPDTSYSDSEVRILEKAAENCPVALSLSGNTEQIVKLRWAHAGH